MSHEHTFETGGVTKRRCGHTTNGMGPCVRPAGHTDGFGPSLHLHEDGTEFSHSGKVGLGKVGTMFHVRVDHDGRAL